VLRRKLPPWTDFIAPVVYNDSAIRTSFSLFNSWLIFKKRTQEKTQLQWPDDGTGIN
jgi:hypothetical protein